MPNRAGNIVLATYLLLFTALVIGGQVYFWDIVPYVATTLLPEYGDAASVHSATYALLQQELSSNAFTTLTTGNYAGDLFNNSEHFRSQLDLYLSKPLYVAALRGLYLLGINPLDGILLLSLLPAIGILVLLYLWLQRWLLPLHCVLIVICFSYAARLLDITQGLVHNNLSSFILLLASFCLLETRQLRLALLLMCSSILIRTDNIIFVGLLQSVLCWQYYQRTGPQSRAALHHCAAGLLVSVLTYLTISALYDQQWWLLFYHTLIESQVDVAAFDTPFSLSLYFATVSQAIGTLFTPSASIASVLPLFLLMLAITIPLSVWKDSLVAIVTAYRPLNLTDIALLTLPVFLAYLILFPLVPAWDRFFTHFYALTSVCIAQAVTRTRQTTEITGRQGSRDH